MKRSRPKARIHLSPRPLSFWKATFYGSRTRNVMSLWVAVGFSNKFRRRTISADGCARTRTSDKTQTTIHVLFAPNYITYVRKCLPYILCMCEFIVLEHVCVCWCGSIWLSSNLHCSNTCISVSGGFRLCMGLFERVAKWIFLRGRNCMYASYLLWKFLIACLAFLFELLVG